jgi:uncharacterized OB-fold protein
MSRRHRNPNRPKYAMPCPECGQIIDARLQLCPKCGTDTDRKLMPLRLVFTFAVIFLVLGVFYFARSCLTS